MIKKRYIEDVLPLGELNKYAQKGGGIGSLNAMHPYFARRPLTASRAMTLAALVAAPSTDIERQTLERLIVALSSEEWPNKPELLKQAQNLIQTAHGGRAPRVLDPFGGGGSMPMEAMRLGCDAWTLDLNPVAYLALISSLVYPQRFGKDEFAKPNSHTLETAAPENISTEGASTLPGMESARGASHSKLVRDVRYWAEWVMEQAAIQIGDCYPKDKDGACPVTYLWANTIRCPHCSGEIPLIKRRWLQDGNGTDPVAYHLFVDRKAQSYTVKILHSDAAVRSDPDKGTMRGATVECIYCGVPSERELIVAQAQAGNLGQRLLVVVLYQRGKSGRDFRAADDDDCATFSRAEEKLRQLEEESFDYWGLDRLLSVIPDEPTPPARARSVSIRLYGITEWSDMFNKRQLLSLITFGKQIRIVRELLAQENPDYARAIGLYLSLVLAKQVVYNSRSAWWQSDGLKTAPTMSRHDIQMTWDYAEANPFSGQATSWTSFIDSLWRSIENAASINSSPAHVQLGSATRLPTAWTAAFDAIICDPPYYDSVTYADLSDFFYPWHKRVVGDDYPEAFVTELTPKDDELVQEAIYHGGTKATAKQYYEDGMAQAFSEMYRVLRDDGIAVIMFAHKKSSAWETLVNALIRAGFQVTASWPLNTEGRRLQSYRAVALASSIYLVCRKRVASGRAVGYLEDLESELRQTIRRYLERFWAAGIGGADFFMSAIGPALSVYSQYETVERYDGKQVGVSKFLDLVRHEAAAFAVERIVGQAGFSERLDPLTQFYLLWHWGYNSWDVPDGEALLFSTAVGIELNVLTDRFGLVGKIKDKMRLLGPWVRRHLLEEVTARVIAGGAVPLVDVLQKACLLWEGNQQEELAALIAHRGGELWPIAQALVELLPRDDPERRALMSMLGTRLSLENRAQTWANQHPSEPRAVQTMLWDNDTLVALSPEEKQTRVKPAP